MLGRVFCAISLNLVLFGSLFAGAANAGEPNFDRARQLYAEGRFQPALAYLDKALSANGSNPTVYYYKALTLQRLGRMSEAMQWYANIRRSFPGTAEAQLANSVLSPRAASSSAPAGAAPTTRAGGPPTADASTNAVAFNPYGGNASSNELASLPDEAKVPFSRAIGGHLYINAFVNNRPMQMLFDTGASTCLFGKNQFSAAGVSPQLTSNQSRMNGVGSKVTTTTEGIVDLRVGDISRHMQVMVADELGTPPLLGETFFNGYRYDIDNQGGFIHFMKKSSSGGRSAYDPIDTVNVPFQQAGNNMVVRAKVNGTECPMYFDTGAGGVVFSQMAAASVGLHIPSDARPVQSGGVGGVAFGYQFEVDRLELGPVVKTHLPVTVLMTGGPPLPLLGQPFFHDRRFTIDNEAHVIKFVH